MARPGWRLRSPGKDGKGGRRGGSGSGFRVRVRGHEGESWAVDRWLGGRCGGFVGWIGSVGWHILRSSVIAEYK